MCLQVHQFYKLRMVFPLYTAFISSALDLSFLSGVKSPSAQKLPSCSRFFKSRRHKGTLICFYHDLPIPDDPPIICSLATNHIPIYYDIAQLLPIACVFAKYKWTCFFLILKNILTVFKTRIHHADHIHKFSVIIFRVSILQSS